MPDIVICKNSDVTWTLHEGAPLGEPTWVYTFWASYSAPGHLTLLKHILLEIDPP